METTMTTERAASPRLRDPRNKRRLIGQKRPLKPKDEITEQTRRAIGEWIADFGTSKGPHLFPSRFEERPHLSTSETRPLKWSQSHRNRHSYLIEIPTLSDEPRYGQSLLPLCP